MAVGDTDFSPPATAVMFLLAIHPTALEAGDSLSISVELPNAKLFMQFQNLMDAVLFLP